MPEAGAGETGAEELTGHSSPTRSVHSLRAALGTPGQPQQPCRLAKAAARCTYVHMYTYTHAYVHDFHQGMASGAGREGKQTGPPVLPVRARAAVPSALICVAAACTSVSTCSACACPLVCPLQTQPGPGCSGDPVRQQLHSARSGRVLPRSAAGSSLKPELSPALHAVLFQ